MLPVALRMGFKGENAMKYRLVSGFETHVELSTNTKIFCSCSTAFGAEPNSQCCPVCTGQPGSLPVLNKAVVEYAVKAGLATNCKISSLSKMDRKNYSYPDLPKAYQISQYDMPLCTEGYVELESGKKIRIERIHIEEDAGKLIHREDGVLVDYNRAGVPLIEIVSYPDIESTQEAKEYVEKLRQIMRYIQVSDCKMQEGSMRCDVNISVCPVDSTELGVRTEIKNMNSISNIAKAMEYEFKRQTELLERGERVTQETLRFDEASGKTFPMRSKEDAKDYRFFREPDLLSIAVPPEEVERIKKTLPALADKRKKQYVEELGISEKDALLLSKYRNVADFFEAVCREIKTPSLAANFILTQIFATFDTEGDKEEFKIKITPADFSEMLRLVEEGKLKNNLAKSALAKMLESGKGIKAFVSEEDMAGLDDNTLRSVCLKTVEENPKITADFKGGKDKALMALVGGVMRSTKGKADAEKCKEILREILSK